MRRTSAVWKNMLFGAWKEAKPTEGPWVVELPEDKPESVRTLLAIIHSKFDIVRTFVYLNQLHDILLVTDKFDMISVIRPWASAWVQMAAFGAGVGEEVSLCDRALGIHVAGELGIDNMLSLETRELIFGAPVVQDGADMRVTYNGKHIRFESYAAPSDLVIAGLRLALIQTLLDFYHAEIRCRTRDEGACQAISTSIYDGNSERPVCDSLLLGSLFRTQHRLGLDPLPLKADKFLGSAHSLMVFLSAMFSALPCLNARHNGCSPSKKYMDFEAKTKSNKKWLDVVRPEHKQRMAPQRKKLGLPKL
ncbi:hypothetical protein N657DRAFT_708927 [Parathielavia appendiculata]|uniref:Uncharacterized protein n=1 Tax=Parathielavia appendiculata TaxID=2587402 RepID=A0AAN6U3X6_9PEZI|nr:hypothetical protein N657DRAFT_708927 [Parathielavia appendiculata]